MANTVITKRDTSFDVTVSSFYYGYVILHVYYRVGKKTAHGVCGNNFVNSQ